MAMNIAVKQFLAVEFTLAIFPLVPAVYTIIRCHKIMVVQAWHNEGSRMLPLNAFGSFIS